MLGDRNVAATVAVRDLGRARSFYEGKLGLRAEPGPNSEVLIFRSGSSSLIVYRSDFAGTNQANSAIWAVGDELEAIVETLRAAGVTFEHYDMPGSQLVGDIHHFGPIRGAWIKDPDGNILHINSG